MSSTANHLIVNLLIDNSILVEELNLNQTVNQLVKNLAALSMEGLKLSIHSFDTFTPQVVKEFDSKETKSLVFDGFPLINALIKNSVEYTESYLTKKTTEAPFEIFRPWLIILSSGLGYDKLDFFETFRSSNKEWQPVIFPFLLLKKYITYELAKINQIKPFMVIKNYDLDAFEKWLKEMIMTRLNTPADQNMTLDKNMFLGWTEL